MDISSKRFNVKDIGGGLASVRDRDAPYHCHTVAMRDLPSIAALAAMTERAFDRAISDLIYA
jgi:hypothetical protein